MKKIIYLLIGILMLLLVFAAEEETTDDGFDDNGINIDDGLLDEGAVIQPGFGGGPFTVTGNEFSIKNDNGETQSFRIEPGSTVSFSGGKITQFTGMLKEAADLLGNGNLIKGPVNLVGGLLGFNGEGSIGKVKIANGEKVSVSDDGIIEGTASADCNVDGVSFPEGTKFKYDPNTKEMVVLEGTKIDKIEDIGDDGIIINSNGKDIELPAKNADGTYSYATITDGKVQYSKDAQGNVRPIIMPGESVTIEGIGKISAGEVKGNTVYNNGDPTELIFKLDTYAAEELDFNDMQNNNIKESTVTIYAGNVVAVRSGVNALSISIENLDSAENEDGLPDETVLLRYRGAAILDIPLDIDKAYTTGMGYSAGDDQEMVKKIQQKVNHRNLVISQQTGNSYTPLVVDGKYGPNTAAAVKNLQQYHLDNTGQLSNTEISQGSYDANTNYGTTEMYVGDSYIKFENNNVVFFKGMKELLHKDAPGGQFVLGEKDDISGEQVNFGIVSFDSKRVHVTDEGRNYYDKVEPEEEKPRVETKNPPQKSEFADEYRKKTPSSLEKNRCSEYARLKGEEDYGRIFTGASASKFLQVNKDKGVLTSELGDTTEFQQLYASKAYYEDRMHTFDDSEVQEVLQKAKTENTGIFISIHNPSSTLINDPEWNGVTHMMYIKPGDIQYEPETGLYNPTTHQQLGISDIEAKGNLALQNWNRIELRIVEMALVTPS